MMRACGEELKVYLYRVPIDMRKGRNGLAVLAQEAMKLDPFSGALFIYVGMHGKRISLCITPFRSQGA
jgi:transposase